MLRALVAIATLGALVGGCASVKSRAPSSVDSDLTELCALDSLRWSYDFVPRAIDRECVTILESVTLAND